MYQRYNLAFVTMRLDAPCKLLAAVVTNSSTLRLRQHASSTTVKGNLHFPCRFYIVNGTSDFAHEPHTAFHGLLRVLLELDLMRDLSLRRILGDLLLSVIPARNIGRLPDVHRAARIDERTRDVVVPGAENQFLVHLGRTRLLACNETRADPHAGSAIREGSSKTMAIGNAASSHDNDGLAREGTFRVLAEVDDCGDEDREGRLAGVSTALATLSTDDIDA